MKTDLQITKEALANTIANMSQMKSETALFFKTMFEIFESHIQILEKENEKELEKQAEEERDIYNESLGNGQR